MDELQPFDKVVLRAGTFADGAGREHKITEDFMRDLAAQYDAEANPAPAVIGHPEMNAPAYGWVEELKLRGGELIARIKPTAAEFVAAVREKKYPKVSVSFFTAGQTSNPKPEKPYLRHVGFLGGAAPAVPNLPLAEFAEAGEILTLADTPPAIFVEQPEETPMPKKEQDNPADFAEREAALKKREDEIAKREAEFAEADKKRAVAEIDERVEKWTKDGKLPPAFADRAKKILTGLESPADFSAANDGKTLAAEFGEMMDEMQKSGVFAAMPAEKKGPKMTAETRGRMIAAKKKEMGEGASFMDAENALMEEKKIPSADMMNEDDS